MTLDLEVNEVEVKGLTSLASVTGSTASTLPKSGFPGDLLTITRRNIRKVHIAFGRITVPTEHGIDGFGKARRCWICQCSKYRPRSIGRHLYWLDLRRSESCHSQPCSSKYLPKDP